MVENAALRDQLVVLKSIPADDSSEQEVESLWRQLMIHESFLSSELAEAKAKRSTAEATRQQTEIESVRNTRAVTKRVRNKAESVVEEAKGLPFWRRPVALLFLMALAMPIAFNTWSALLNNFVIEVADFDGSDIGLLHTVRLLAPRGRLRLRPRVTIITSAAR